MNLGTKNPGQFDRGFLSIHKFFGFHIVADKVGTDRNLPRLNHFYIAFEFGDFCFPVIVDTIGGNLKIQSLKICAAFNHGDIFSEYDVGGISLKCDIVLLQGPTAGSPEFQGGQFDPRIVAGNKAVVEMNYDITADDVLAGFNIKILFVGSEIFIIDGGKTAGGKRKQQQCNKNNETKPFHTGSLALWATTVALLIYFHYNKKLSECVGWPWENST